MPLLSSPLEAGIPLSKNNYLLQWQHIFKLKTGMHREEIVIKNLIRERLIIEQAPEDGEKVGLGRTHQSSDRCGSHSGIQCACQCIR